MAGTNIAVKARRISSLLRKNSTHMEEKNLKPYKYKPRNFLAVPNNTTNIFSDRGAVEKFQEIEKDQQVALINQFRES